MAISNFFENSQRYSRLKVHHWCHWHRWQMEKIFSQKNWNYLVWTHLGSRVNIYVNFCLQVHFKESAAWYCFHIFATGVVDTGGAPWLANLREFSKKFETVLMGYSGAGGKLTHEKNQKQKILWHCPFKYCAGATDARLNLDPHHWLLSRILCWAVNMYMLKRLWTWLGKGNLNFQAITIIYAVENNTISFPPTFLALGNTRSALFDNWYLSSAMNAYRESPKRCLCIL